MTPLPQLGHKNFPYRFKTATFNHFSMHVVRYNFSSTGLDKKNKNVDFWSNNITFTQFLENELHKFYMLIEPICYAKDEKNIILSQSGL